MRLTTRTCVRSNRHGPPRATTGGRVFWLDMLSRDLLESGRFERLQEKRAVTGATSNPMIFGAIAGSDRYDGQRVGRLETGVNDPRE
jgi:transaldolase